MAVAIGVKGKGQMVSNDIFVGIGVISLGGEPTLENPGVCEICHTFE